MKTKKKDSEQEKRSVEWLNEWVRHARQEKRGKIQYVNAYGRIDKRTKNLVLEIKPPYRVQIDGDELTVSRRYWEEPNFLSRKRPIHVSLNDKEIDFKEICTKKEELDFYGEVSLESTYGCDFDEYPPDIIEY